MAHPQSPHFQIWQDEPATPASKTPIPDDLENGPQTPCDFMPQSAAPVMILSSTSRCTRKSMDERALRLLHPVSGESNSFPQPVISMIANAVKVSREATTTMRAMRMTSKTEFDPYTNLFTLVSTKRPIPRRRHRSRLRPNLRALQPRPVFLSTSSQTFGYTLASLRPRFRHF